MVLFFDGFVKLPGLRQWNLRYDLLVKPRKKKDAVDRPIFDSIRKPTAPPSQRFGGPKPEEKVHPAKRKQKHKKPVGELDP